MLANDRIVMLDAYVIKIFLFKLKLILELDSFCNCKL